MKTRNGFVSNSSSSSFLVKITNSTDSDVSLKDWAEEHKKELFMAINGDEEYYQEIIDNEDDPFNEDYSPWYDVLTETDINLEAGSSKLFIMNEDAGGFKTFENVKELEPDDIDGVSVTMTTSS